MTDHCAVIGAGGHAKVVVDAIKLQGRYQPVAITDSDPRTAGKSVMEVPVVGGDEKIPELIRHGIKHFVVGVGAVTSPRVRKRLFDMAVDYGLMPITVVHPAAVVASSAIIGPGSVVLAGAIINPDARIDQNVIVNTSAVVEHDCVVESHVHLCPGVRLSGGVRVGEGSLLGAGCVVKQNVRIGRWAIIGMGSVVLTNVKNHQTVAGAPAKALSKGGL